MDIDNQLEEWRAKQPEKEAKMLRELAAFDAMREELCKNPEYKDKHVAIHEGKVIYVHDDLVEVAMHIEALARKVGPIAICEVYDKDDEDDEEVWDAVPTPLVFDEEKLNEDES
jgi:hypothetical protein